MSSRNASRFVVIGIVVVVLAVVVAGLMLRSRMRCAGFEGPGVSAEELPAGPPASSNLRIAVWNIRNFPLDERPQFADLGYSRRTNICDLEDVLRGLQSDVFGLAEIRDSRRFPPILRRAVGERSFRVGLSGHGGTHGQRVGIAWDTGRLEVGVGPEEVSEVAIEPALRPAIAAYLVSRSTGGVDFSLIQVHLRSAPSGFRTRIEQYRILARETEAWALEVGDEDVMVMGDFNTTGAEDGTVEEELRIADQILGGAGLRRLENIDGCSEYWEGYGEPDGVQIPSLLDHVYVRGLEELDESVPVEAWLQCRRAGCEELVSRPGQEDGTFWDVSDHCPLTFEIRDRDID